MWTRRAFLPTLALLPSAVGAAARDAEGFEPLFNGRDLTGWHVENGPSTAFFADQGDLVVHRGANFPTWLRSDREYENFEFRCEFFMKGWINSGILLRAARYGNPTDTGLQLNLFHKLDKTPLKESCGSIFPVLAPSKGDAHKTGEWNTLRIVADWPRLQVWINDTPVQDVDLATHPELRWRLRRGYLGIESLSYPIRLRNLRIRELPSKDRWQTLYAAPQDWDKWFLAEGKEETWERLGPVLRCD